jgi:hypothetical protein
MKQKGCDFKESVEEPQVQREDLVSFSINFLSVREPYVLFSVLYAL